MNRKTKSIGSGQYEIRSAFVSQKRFPHSVSSAMQESKFTERARIED
jgi:hypothetical protein